MKLVFFPLIENSDTKNLGEATVCNVGTHVALMAVKFRKYFASIKKTVQIFLVCIQKIYVEGETAKAVENYVGV